MTWVLIGAAVAPVLGGFAIQRAAPRRAGVAFAWVLALAALVATELATRGSAPFVRMLALVAAMLLGMKAVVGSAARTPLAFSRWLLFCGWPGMDPRTFARRARRGGAGRLARDGAVCLALGLVIVGLARLGRLGRTAAECAVFVGSSLAVHFGAFALLTALLRACGFPAERLFRAPWQARSLTEFWSQRWNLGFVEMTAIAVFRPLRRRLGGARANLVAFLSSGLLHECAITLPVHTGHGGPLGYFALQAAAVALERRLGLRGRIWTFVCLVLPLPLLFPPAFRAMVVGALLG